MRIRSLWLLLFLFSPVWAQPDLSERVDSVLPHAVELYKWFHSHPELSRKEEKTAQRLAQELRELGLDVTEGVGGFGVVAVLEGAPGGPVILYRADMDALPIQEATGLPFASQNEGVMHACGHDIHMSCAVATLSTLASMKQEWRGTILFVGQPAEEVGSGAEAVIADPKFQAILTGLGKPKLALALHDDAVMEPGQASLIPGYVTANVDSVNITVHGRGGHGALPDQAVDPIVIGSEIVGALQTIVSRRLPPGTRAVVTVGVFQAGTKRNIIPPEAELKLTVRSYEEDTRQRILTEIRHISAQVAAAHHAPKPPTIKHYDRTYTPAGFNDRTWARKLRPVFLDYLGVSNLIDMPPRMVGEDFSEYSKRLHIPSVLFLLGASPAGPEKPGLHSDKFAPEVEPTLRTGCNLMVRLILAALED